MNGETAPPPVSARAAPAGRSAAPTASALSTPSAPPPPTEPDRYIPPPASTNHVLSGSEPTERTDRRTRLSTAIAHLEVIPELRTGRPIHIVSPLHSIHESKEEQGRRFGRPLQGARQPPNNIGYSLVRPLDNFAYVPCYYISRSPVLPLTNDSLTSVPHTYLTTHPHPTDL